MGDEEEESQNGSSSGDMADEPLCVFYFNHPCSVDGEDDHVESYGRYQLPPTYAHRQLSSRRRAAPRRREKLTERRTPHRATVRRCLREPPRDLKSYLFSNRSGGCVVDLDIVLKTVREAWIPLRSYSLDRNLDQSSSGDRLAGRQDDMGTGGRSSRASHIRPPVPILAGLPNRRYSVPETIMRKYNLTKQDSDSNNSDNGAVTVPTLTPETMSGSSPIKSNVYGSSLGQGGRTPPEDRRRKQGRASLGDDFKRTGRHKKNLKGPPMYKGSKKGNVESLSDGMESDGKISDEMKESGDVGEQKSEREKAKSPECLECKVFLGVIAEENEKVINKDMNKSKNVIGQTKPILESGYKTPKINTPAVENVKGRFRIIPIEIQTTIDESSSPESIESFKNTGLPLNDILDGYSPTIESTEIIPSNRSESNHKSHTSSTSDQVLDQHTLSSSPNSRETQSKNTSLETASDEQLMTPFEAELQTSDDSERKEKSSTEGTSGFNDQTTPGTEGTSSMSDKIETTTDSNTNQVPFLDLGSESCSLTPISSHSSVTTSPDRPSVESSLTNERTSSMTLYQPNTDRSSSTQDSTISIPSDSVTQSRAFSLLSSHSEEQEGIIESEETNELDFETKDNNGKTEQVDDSIVKEKEFIEEAHKLDLGEDCFDSKTKNNEYKSASSTSHSSVANDEPLHEDITASNENIHIPDAKDEYGKNDSEYPITNKSKEVLNKNNHAKEDDDSKLSDIENNSPINLSNTPSGDSHTPELKFGSSKNTNSPYNNNSDIDNLRGQSEVEVFSRPSSTYTPNLRTPVINLPTESPKELVFSPESHITEETKSDIYSWNNRFDEDQYVKLTNQRQRYWMNRKPSGVSLPLTPIHGALTGVKAGTIYCKNNYDVQLVVPRYSALPRSISMLVNTSSADCSSNSSDSESLSAIDSLDEIAAKSPKHYHNYKPHDMVQLLPEETEGNFGDKLKLSTSPGKVKPFYISMDEPEKSSNESPVMSTLLPDKLKKKLNERHQTIELKRQKKVKTQELKGKEIKAQEMKMRKEQRIKSKGKKSPFDKSGKVLGKREVQSDQKDIKEIGSNFNEDSQNKLNMNEEEQYLVHSVNIEDRGSKKTNENGVTKLPQKSSIPVMKLPVNLNNTPPASNVNNHHSSSSSSTPSPSSLSLKPSQLPIRRRHQSPPMRRSANLLGNRFQQRFEVIPEERSGSLESSNEEPGRTGRTRPVSLPTSKQSPRDNNSDEEMKNRNSEGLPSNLTRTKRSNNEGLKNLNKRLARPTRSIRPNNTMSGPLIESVMIQEVDDEPYKGRAALAPHTDEGMSSLSKGWINFYLLKDGGKSSPENHSDDALLTLSDREKKNSTKNPIQALKTVNVVGGSGNRIRTYTIPNHTLPSETRPSSTVTFPALHSGSNSRKPSLVTEDRLSDVKTPDGKRITAYLHIPNQRVPPPYLYEGSDDQDSSESSSVTSSESESERSFSPALLPVRWPIRQQQRRLPPHRTKAQHYRSEFQQYPRQGSANVGVGWTVTVAGSNNQNQPDLEMRLSFPTSARRPPNSQSDSGLGEDNNNNNRGNQGENRTKKQTLLPLATPIQTTQRWTLTVKNGSERMQEMQKAEKNLFPGLPELSNQPGQIKNAKKANKRANLPVTSIGEKYTAKTRQLSAVWPRDQTIIESKFTIRKTTARYSRDVRSVSQLLEDAEEETILRSGLAVTGSAINPEKKPRVPTMSERDLTRGQTARR